MRYFSVSEFFCECCGKQAMKMDTLLKLDEARDIAGIPFNITSGYRCIKHNAAVGGAPSSSHTRGHGADIWAPDSHRMYKIVKACLEAGFNRVIIYDQHVHVDDDPNLPQEVLFYNG